MTSVKPLHLFAAYGVELEYMIVGERDLNVRPIADDVLRTSPGADPPSDPDDVEFDDITWSNELVRHVIELKTTTPAPQLSGLADQFQDHIARIEAKLEPHGARLMPTAMHPWMNPARETQLWPYGNNEIYNAYNRIFDCRGHGWSNVQCVHLNLPFTGDGEFGHLHAAIRALLPILPAIAASSPFMEGTASDDMLDARLECYKANQRAVPSIAGQIVPEAVFSKFDYDKEILQRAYRDIAPHDPDGLLQHEWLNSRGAIARFERGSIEIRVLDIQECPAADLAILALIVGVLRALIAERWAPMSQLKALKTEPLAAVFSTCARHADEAMISDPAILEVLGWRATIPCVAGELWRFLAREVWSDITATEHRDALRVILNQGCLARRILKAAGRSLPTPDHARLHEIYTELADCLRHGRLFGA